MKPLMSPKNNFARNIGELMYEHDMTDKEIAQILEVSMDEWMDKKQFKAPMTLEELMFLAACFDVPVDHLFFTWRTRVENRTIQNGLLVHQNTQLRTLIPTLRVQLNQVLGNVVTHKYDRQELKGMKALIERLLEIANKKDEDEQND